MSEAATIIDSKTEKKTRMLTLTEKLDVRYCIENWLRDEQIRLNCANVKGRIEANYEKRSEPIAVVNFGPSLKHTWEKIKEFKFVMTCSGAHKFCVEHGIVPTHHIDVDPRLHKVMLLGEPQKETEYLIASTCHPALMEHLKGYNLKLWHIFDTSEDGLRLLPRGEWALTGGCSVGVRTLTMARFLGFTDIHVFGMDGCYADDESHAGDHPNKPKCDLTLIEYPEGSGRTYRTTPTFLEAAKNTWHELDLMKDTKVQFYGEGLVQEMAKNYKRPENVSESFIAFNKPELISTDYLKMNEQLHWENLAYGVGGGRHAETVIKLVKRLSETRKEWDSEFVSVLDYGCGKGYLGKALPFPIYEYDPAIPGKTESPRPADLVVCTDVLEHIEPERLDFVLDDMARCTRRAAFIIVATGSSYKTLADGRNSHLIVEGEEFWRKKLGNYFFIPEKGITIKKHHLVALVVPKGNKYKQAGNTLKAA
jgi:uncharacterized Rossmann fold enzyme